MEIPKFQRCSVIIMLIVKKWMDLSETTRNELLEREDNWNSKRRFGQFTNMFIAYCMLVTIPLMIINPGSKYVLLFICVISVYIISFFVWFFYYFICRNKWLVYYENNKYYYLLYDIYFHEDAVVQLKKELDEEIDKKLYL
jgi:Mn2+/Fe2+ NRAMP family transporter